MNILRAKLLSNALNWLALCLFSAIFFGAISYKLILIPNGPAHEYGSHILFAIQMYQENRIVLPHFLFQWLTIVHHHLFEAFQIPTYKISGINNPTITYDWGFSAFVVMLEAYIGIEILLAYYLKIRFQNIHGYKNSAYWVAFFITICTPLFLLAPVDGKLYLGYITPSTIYIIPTQILLKLPSLALFLLTPLIFTRNNDSAKLLFSLACLALLSGLAKPNWLIIMVPALALITLIHLNKDRYVNWRALCVTLISSAGVLGWQFYFKYVDQTSPIYKSKIIITPPFEVWGHHSDFIAIKTLLSVAFPLYISVAFKNKVKDDFYCKYAWVLFVFGLIYLCFLGESVNKFAANFVWSAEIACFMLFVATTALFFEKCLVDYQNNRMKVTLGLMLFCAHVVCGLIYYFRAFESVYV